MEQGTKSALHFENTKTSPFSVHHLIPQASFAERFIINFNGCHHSQGIHRKPRHAKPVDFHSIYATASLLSGNIRNTLNKHKTNCSLRYSGAHGPSPLLQTHLNSLPRCSWRHGKCKQWAQWTAEDPKNILIMLRCWGLHKVIPLNTSLHSTRS